MTFLMAASRATGRIGCDEIAKRLAHLFHATKVLGQVTNSAAKFCYDGPGPVAPELFCTAAIVPCYSSNRHRVDRHRFDNIAHSRVNLVQAA